MSDETRGKSMIDPVNYKNDVLTQAWVDSRTLATLMMWLDSVGAQPRTMSDIVRIPLKTIVKHLVSVGEVKMIDDTNVARQILAKRTGVDLSRGGRGGKNVLHNVVLDARRSELGGHIKDVVSDVDVPRIDEPIHDGPEGFDMEKALELFEGDDE